MFRDGKKQLRTLRFVLHVIVSKWQRWDEHPSVLSLNILCLFCLHNTVATIMQILLFLINLFIYLFIYFWLCWVFVAVRGLFSSCGEQGLLFVVVCGLFTAVASLVAEHGLVAHRLQ